MNEQVRRHGMYMAWIIALVATLGSLYFSEIRGFVPCELCWSQRIFMYPLSIILGVAVFNNDSGVVRYVLPLSLIGGSISVYHYMVQKIPGFAEVKPCLQGVPCNVQYINWLGFITIPFLALTAFLLITLIMIGVRQAFKKN